MANKLNIPKVKYTFTEPSEVSCASIYVSDKLILMVMPYYDTSERPEIEKDICIVTSDALNTYQACELLPSDLLQQRNELLNAIKMALMLLPRGMVYNDCKELLTSIQQ